MRGKHEKIGFDSTAGWLGYLSKEGQLLIKRFPVVPERPYGEMVVRKLNHAALDRPTQVYLSWLTCQCVRGRA